MSDGIMDSASVAEMPGGKAMENAINNFNKKGGPGADEHFQAHSGHRQRLHFPQRYG